ncbi:4-methylaminobutanoate oxidase (formaldehyde-forming) [mine drainage metagenome]|uniref:4-methylaminobutanoate oxidase (Formaldehyde-forming) n=1 Tax=mine drainage metagenome TaxID=410659 RepID=A0A1J5TAG0_9ZZZZ
MVIEKADVVIVGGGVFGNSIAYHYAKNNPAKKIIVLERNELCNAATSRAAAMITKIRAKKEFIPLAKQTYVAIDEMEKLLGESLDIKKVGILHIAASESKVNDLDELVKTADTFHERWEYISAEKAEQMTPWLDASSALKIAFMPDEAYCDPYLLGTFYARSAKLLSADIRQGIEVTDILMDGNTATGVVTTAGIIEADVVIIASGAWAPVLAKKAGINLALAPVRSQYWITERNEIFPATSPMVVLPDVNAYLRPESGALLFGIRERRSIAVSPKDIPNDISSFKFSDDKGMNDLSEVIDKLAKFFPKIYDIGLKYYIAGFSAYTPDNYLSMGSTAQKNNLLFATGCVGAGIAVCGGVGLAFAEMAAGKTNPYDFSAFNIHRFGEIDPFGEEWLQRCAVARSVKNSG